MPSSASPVTPSRSASRQAGSSKRACIAPIAAVWRRSRLDSHSSPSVIAQPARQRGIDQRAVAVAVIGGPGLVSALRLRLRGGQIGERALDVDGRRRQLRRDEVPHRRRVVGAQAVGQPVQRERQRADPRRGGGGRRRQFRRGFMRTVVAELAEGVARAFGARLHGEGGLRGRG